MNALPKADDNLISQAMVFALMRAETRLQAAKTDASRALSAHRKRLKTYGLKVKNFLAVYALVGASDDGDAYLQDLREQRRLADLMSLPVGHQFSILDEFDAAGVRDQGDPRAYKKGMRAYLEELPESDCPHALNTDDGQQWVEGWRAAETLFRMGEKELEALDAGAPHPDDAANGTMPANPVSAKRRGRPKKSVAANGADHEASAPE